MKNAIQATAYQNLELKKDRAIKIPRIKSHHFEILCVFGRGAGGGLFTFCLVCPCLCGLHNRVDESAGQAQNAGPSKVITICIGRICATRWSASAVYEVPFCSSNFTEP